MGAYAAENGGEAEAAAAGSRREERNEDLRLDLLAHPFSFVHDFDERVRPDRFSLPEVRAIEDVGIHFHRPGPDPHRSTALGAGVAGVGHEREDELFLVVKGRFRMALRTGDLWVNEGEFLIIPKGVEHMPVADEECHVILLEPKTTLNTGNVCNERTLPELERI